MDIGQFIFPFIMAVLSNSIMIVIVYFLRKIPAFVNLFGVSLLVALYLFCVMRIFVPIELPGVHVILQDNTVYTSVVDFFSVRVSDNTLEPKISFYVLLGIWAAGTATAAVITFVRQRSFRRFIDANGDYSTDRERAIFSDVVREILKSDKHITLKKTDAVSGTMIVGLIRITVLIPDDTYTDDELRMMFRHECIHIRNKDLWLKLLVHIYCCLFWWNPVAYLLKSDLDTTLEIKCDLKATSELSASEKLAYVETLCARCIADRRQKAPLAVSAQFAVGKKKTVLKKRIRAILADPPNKAGQIAAVTAAAAIVLSIFIASYLFIWQPYYRPTDEMYDLADGDEIIDETNSYIVKNEDGTFEFYVDGYPPIPVTQEEIKQGLFEGYPIYEK